MKLTRKFVLGLVIGILLVHAGSAFQRVRQVSGLIRADVEKDARILGRALALAVERNWQARGENDALGLLKDTADYSKQAQVRWVWISDDRPYPGQLPVVERKAIWRRLTSGEQVVVERERPEAIIAYTPVHTPDNRLGAIEIVDDLGDELPYVRSSIRNVILTTIVLVALCGAVAWVVGSLFIGRPMRDLVAQARRIGAGDLSLRLPITQKDEIGALAQEMNRMCDGLEQARDKLTGETKARIAAVEQLRHADRLTTSGTLAAGLAHELGTPINVVAGHAELVLEEPAASETIREAARVIHEQCKRMARIIRQMLDFARSGKKKGAAEGVECDPVAVARQTLAMVEPLARKRNIDAAVAAGGEAHAGISADELQQVLANLLLNAIEAMPNGGALSVRVEQERRAAPAESEAREMVAIAVEDDGVGMAPEVAERVFEPFFTTKDVGEGTGLGLAVAYGIVQDHQGWIDVASQPGRGTRFTVMLPRRRTA